MMTGQAPSQRHSKDFSIWKNNSAEEQEAEEKREIASEIIKLWEDYSRRYREYPSLYVELLEKKRELKITLNAICKESLDSYPESKIFSIEDEDELKRKLGKMKLGSLIYHREKCLQVKYNATFREMDVFIANSKRQIEQKTQKKTKIAPNPDRLHIHSSTKYKSTFIN